MELKMFWWIMQSGCLWGSLAKEHVPRCCYSPGTIKFYIQLKHYYYMLIVAHLILLIYRTSKRTCPVHVQTIWILLRYIPFTIWSAKLPVDKAWFDQVILCVLSLQCFFPQNLVSDIKTPMFLLNSAYDSWQVNNHVSFLYLDLNLIRQCLLRSDIA